MKVSVHETDRTKRKRVQYPCQACVVLCRDMDMDMGMDMRQRDRILENVSEDEIPHTSLAVL